MLFRPDVHSNVVGQGHFDTHTAPIAIPICLLSSSIHGYLTDKERY